MKYNTDYKLDLPELKFYDLKQGDVFKIAGNYKTGIAIKTEGNKFVTLSDGETHEALMDFVVLKYTGTAEFRGEWVNTHERTDTDKQS